MIEPVVKEVQVPADPAAAFRRFTEEIGTWWPRQTHSVSKDRSVAVRMEPRVGGRLYEEDDVGAPHVWGTLTAYEPPHRVAFTWHPGRGRETAQQVTVTFDAEADGTRVRLVHAGWETFGDEAARMRADYDQGWPGVIERYARSFEGVTTAH